MMIAFAAMSQSHTFIKFLAKSASVCQPSTRRMDLDIGLLEGVLAAAVAEENVERRAGDGYRAVRVGRQAV